MIRSKRFFQMRRAIGFDGKDYLFNFSKNKARKDRGGKSSYHSEARILIKEEYPIHSLYEEVTLPGSKRSAIAGLLYADFFIPDLNLIIETHGEQHYKYIPFFHKSKAHFLLSVKRDRDKEEWCRINNITLLVLPYNKRDEWKQRLMR